jgi:hypothetical protein
MLQKHSGQAPLRERGIGVGLELARCEYVVACESPDGAASGRLRAFVG